MKDCTSTWKHYHCTLAEGHARFHECWETEEDTFILLAEWNEHTGFNYSGPRLLEVDPTQNESPYRMCHGCLVDGMDHNCGYTGL